MEALFIMKIYQFKYLFGLLIIACITQLNASKEKFEHIFAAHQDYLKATSSDNQSDGQEVAQSFLQIQLDQEESKRQELEKRINQTWIEIKKIKEIAVQKGQSSILQDFIQERNSLKTLRAQLKENLTQRKTTIKNILNLSLQKLELQYQSNPQQKIDGFEQAFLALYTIENVLRKTQDDQDDDFLSEQAWEDLDILGLLKAIDQTETIVGRLCLANLLVQPSTKPQDLAVNLEVLHEIHANTNLFESLEILLKKYALAEAKFLAFSHKAQHSMLMEQELELLEQAEAKFTYYFLTPLLTGCTDATTYSLKLLPSLIALGFKYGAPGAMNLMHHITPDFITSFFNKITPSFVTSAYETTSSLYSTITNWFSPSTSAFSLLPFTDTTFLAVAGLNQLTSRHIPASLKVPTQFLTQMATGISYFQYALLTTPITGAWSFISAIKANKEKKDELMSQIAGQLENTKYLLNCLQEIHDLLQENDVLNLQDLAHDLAIFIEQKETDSALGRLLTLFTSEDVAQISIKEMYETLKDALVKNDNEEEIIIFARTQKAVGMLDTYISRVKLVLGTEETMATGMNPLAMLENLLGGLNLDELTTAQEIEGEKLTPSISATDSDEAPVGEFMPVSQLLEGLELPNLLPTSTQYCFVNYTYNTTTPIINLSDCFNPFNPMANIPVLNLTENLEPVQLQTLAIVLLLAHLCSLGVAIQPEPENLCLEITKMSSELDRLSTNEQGLRFMIADNSRLAQLPTCCATASLYNTITRTLQNSLIPRTNLGFAFSVPVPEK